MNLMKFQLNAIRELLIAMEDGSRDIILKSPTGSGKTIILTHFMSEYVKGQARTVFVWLPLEWVVLDEQETAPAYFLFANNKNGETYRDLIEKALEEIRADGTLSKISIKWFGKDYSVPPTKN